MPPSAWFCQVIDPATHTIDKSTLEPDRMMTMQQEDHFIKINPTTGFATYEEKEAPPKHELLISMLHVLLTNT